MKRALIVVESDEHSRTLIQEAGALAEGVGAELELLTVLDADKTREDLETMEAIADVVDTSYNLENVKESGRQFARDIAAEELVDVDVDYAAACVIAEGGEEAQKIVSAAETDNCDHIFIAGRRRSPTGKAIFGDVAQQVILNFDGIVSVVTK